MALPSPEELERRLAERARAARPPAPEPATQARPPATPRAEPIAPPEPPGPLSIVPPGPARSVPTISAPESMNPLRERREAEEGERQRLAEDIGARVRTPLNRYPQMLATKVAEGATAGIEAPLTLAGAAFKTGFSLPGVPLPVRSEPVGRALLGAAAAVRGRVQKELAPAEEEYPARGIEAKLAAIPAGFVGFAVNPWAKATGEMIGPVGGPLSKTFLGENVITPAVHGAAFGASTAQVKPEASASEIAGQMVHEAGPSATEFAGWSIGSAALMRMVRAVFGLSAPPIYHVIEQKTGAGQTLSPEEIGAVQDAVRRAADMGLKPPPDLKPIETDPTAPATPWAKVLEAKGLGGRDIEQKVKAGQPLTKEEADAVRHGAAEVQTLTAPPPPVAPAAEGAPAAPRPNLESASAGEIRTPLNVTPAMEPARRQPVEPSQASGAEPGKIRYNEPSTSQKPVTSTGLAPGFDPTTQHEHFHDTDRPDELLRRATLAAPKLESFLEGVPGRIESGVRVKDYARLAQKSEVEGRTASTLSDILGGRVVVNDFDQAREALNWLTEHGEIVRVKDWMHRRHPWGFRGINVTMLPEGVPFTSEVQIMLPEFVKASDVEHKIYEKWRARGDLAEGTPQFAEMEREHAESLGRWNKAEQAAMDRVEAARRPAPEAAAAPAETPATAPETIRPPPETIAPTREPIRPPRETVAPQMRPDIPPPAAAGAVPGPKYLRGHEAEFETWARGRGHEWPVSSPRKMAGLGMAFASQLRRPPKPPAPVEPAARVEHEAAAEATARVDSEVAAATAPATTGQVPSLRILDLFKPEAAPKSPLGKLIVDAATRLESGMGGLPRTPKAVERWAASHGGSIDDAYDAIEVARNVHLRDWRDQARKSDLPLATRLQSLAEIEKSMGRRAASLDIKHLQQFSTPYPISEGLAEAAGARAGETVMEPNAGTGSLVEPFTGRRDLRLWLNELDQRRVNALRAAGYEAHQGDFFRILPVSPQVVVMNPPWGTTGRGKYFTPPYVTEFKANDLAQYHIAHALDALGEGGRLVALVGENYTADASLPFRKWLKDGYALRAEIMSPPNAYLSRGTSYGSVMLVVDKVSPDVKLAGPERFTPKDWKEYADAISAVTTGRLARPTDAALMTAGQMPTTPPEVADARAEGIPERAPEQRPGRPGPERGARRRKGDRELRADAGGAGADVVPAERPQEPKAPELASAEQVVPGSVSERAAASEQDLAARRERDLDEVRRSTLFAPYAVRGRWAGTRHPRLVITTSSLASVETPPITYTPHPEVLALNKKGWIGDENMDAIAMAVQQNLAGRGYLGADGTGFGKSRQVVGIALDWIKSGHGKRLLLVSSRQTNISDLLQTFEHSEAKLPPLVRLTDYKVRGKAATEAEQIPVHETGVYLIDANNLLAYKDHLLRLKFDGLIADEADDFLNLVSGRGAAWTELHKDILNRNKKPLFVYTTASPATFVDDLEYLHGLRLWPMDRFADWLGLISGGMKIEEFKAAKEKGDSPAMRALKEAAAQGDEEASRQLTEMLSEKRKEGWGDNRDQWESTLTTAATEQVMRELAAEGVYMSRELWRGGMEATAPEMRLTPEKVRAFDRRIALMRRVQQTYDKYAAQNRGLARKFGIRSALQFHYKQSLFDLNLDNTLKMAHDYMGKGHQVVLSLINVRGTADEAGEGNIASAIKRINNQKVDKDDDGTLVNLGPIPQAIRDKAELMEDLAKECPPLRDPLDTIRKSLGEKNVVFVTGAESNAQKVANIRRFQEGKVQVIVISGAGKRGINLQHVVRAPAFGPAEGRRAMIIADMQWAAAPTLQEIGRVDRANQITAPVLVIPHMGLAAQKKFIGITAFRLGQLGAASKGMEGSTGTDFLDDFVIGGRADSAAMRIAYQELPDDLKDLFMKREFRDSYDPTRPASQTNASFNTFMLDLQLMPLDKADAIYQKFLDVKERLANDPKHKVLGAARAARAQGHVLEKAQVGDDMVLYRVKTAGAKIEARDVPTSLEAYAKSKGYDTQRPASAQEYAAVKAEYTEILRAARGGGTHEYGILTGKMATTGRLSDVVRDIYSLEEAGDAGSYNRLARYVSLQDLDSGKWISGLEIPHGKMPLLVEKYGVRMTRRTSTPETIGADLQSGLKVQIRGAGGETWTLRRRRDGRNVIDGAKIRDERALIPNGLPQRAAFSAAGQYWWVPDEMMPELLSAFPIVPQGPEPAARGQVVESAASSETEKPEAAPAVRAGPSQAEIDAKAATTPGTLTPDQTEVAHHELQAAIESSAGLPKRLHAEAHAALDLAVRGKFTEFSPRAVASIIPVKDAGWAPNIHDTVTQTIGAVQHGLARAGEAATRGKPTPEETYVPEAENSAGYTLEPGDRVRLTGDVGGNTDLKPLAGRSGRIVEREGSRYRLVPDNALSAKHRAGMWVDGKDLTPLRPAAAPAATTAPTAEQADAAAAHLGQALKELIAVRATRRAAETAGVPYAKVVPHDSTDIAAMDRRAAYLRAMIPRVATVGQTHAIPEMEAELRSLAEQRESVEAASAASEAPKLRVSYGSIDMGPVPDAEGPPASAPVAVGKRDYMLTPQGRIDFVYEVLPADSIIPSHNPQTFRPNPRYPEGVQNRPYHSDKAEQAKVIRQAASFESRFVLSTSPDAINGPPILAPESNVVVGGNSRAMTIMRLDPGTREAYAAELRARLGEYGIADREVPADAVLVRRVTGQPGDADRLRALARAFNEPLTQALNQEAEAVSRGKAVSEETFSTLSGLIQDQESGSIADLLRSRPAVDALVPALIRDGVFSRSDINRYTSGAGDLNDAGRAAIEKALLGAVVDDPDLLTVAPASLLNKIAKSLAPVAEVRDRPGWDLTGRLKQALMIARRADAAGMTVPEWLSQGALFGQGETPDDVAMLAYRLAGDKPTAFASRLAGYARDSRADIAGQGRLDMGEKPDPGDAFGAWFGGDDANVALQLKPPLVEARASEAGFIAPELLGLAPGKKHAAAEFARGVSGFILDSVRRAWREPLPEVGGMPPEPIPTARLKRFIRELGPERGRLAFNTIRRHENAQRLIAANLRKDTLEWLGTLTEQQDRQLFEVAKGVRIDPDTGAMAFGGLQPAGLLQLKGRKTLRAVNRDMGIDMEWNDALHGGTLAGGLEVGEFLPQLHAIQLYRRLDPDASRLAYQTFVTAVPKGKEILDDYIAIREETRVDPLYGMTLPPRSREVARALYDIKARRPDEVPYVPTIVKEPRTFVGRVRRALYGLRSQHRRLKTGEAAESGMEIKSFMDATLDVRSSLMREEVRNRLANMLIPLVLEPHTQGEPMPDGYVEFSRGVVKEPEKIAAWATRNTAFLAEHGIDSKHVVQAVMIGGGKRYRVSKRILPDLDFMAGADRTSTDPQFRRLSQTADQLGRATVNYVLLNYLVRPATAVRNHVTEGIRDGMRTMRDLIEDSLLLAAPSTRWQQLPMSQFVADIVSPWSSLTADSREAFPPEALGTTFARDLGHTTLPGRMLRYNTFEAGEMWSKRRLYESVALAQGANAWRAARLAGKDPGPLPEFIRQYRKSLPPEVENYAYRLMDVVGSGDYRNVALPLERLKTSQIGRATVAYPTYLWKLLTGSYNNYYGPRQYAELFGPGRSTRQRIRAFSNLAAGAATAAIFWSLIPDAWDDYPEGLKDEDIPPEYRTGGRVRIARDKNDQGYWLRILDLPIIGDIVAAKGIFRGHYTFREWLDDRISTGPLVSIVGPLLGLTDQYQRDLPTATVMGGAVAGFTPMAPVWQYLRRLEDPYRRRLYRDGAPWYENFARSYANNFPVLSRKLDIAHAREAPHLPLTYEKPAEHSKFWFMNVRTMREGERRAAIRDAYMKKREDEINQRLPRW